MTDSAVQHITSRDNPLLKQLRQLVQHNTAYRREGRCWVEGEHLCDAALRRGLRPEGPGSAGLRGRVGFLDGEGGEGERGHERGHGVSCRG